MLISVHFGVRLSSLPRRAKGITGAAQRAPITQSKSGLLDKWGSEVDSEPRVAVVGVKEQPGGQDSKARILVLKNDTVQRFSQNQISNRRVRVDFARH